MRKFRDMQLQNAYTKACESILYRGIMCKNWNKCELDDETANKIYCIAVKDCADMFLEKHDELGSPSASNIGDCCRALAAEMLKIAHNCDHAKDFCAPEYDKEEKEKQIEKLRDIMEV